MSGSASPADHQGQLDRLRKGIDEAAIARDADGLSGLSSRVVDLLDGVEQQGGVADHGQLLVLNGLRAFLAQSKACLAWLWSNRPVDSVVTALQASAA